MESEFTLVAGHFVVDDSEKGHENNADDADQNCVSENQDYSAEESPSL